MWGNPESNSKEYIESFIDNLDKNYFYSVMFPYDPFLGDWMLKIAPIVKNTQKIKYIFAIRTYAISPEYMAMMLNQFDEYYPDRAMLNVLAGDKTQMKTEQEKDNTLNAALFRDKFFKYPEERIVYTNNWLEQFVNLKILNKKPEIAITGTSDLTLQNVKEYGDYAGCMNYTYVNEFEKFNSVADKRIVMSGIYIAKDEKHYQEIIEKAKSDENFNMHFTLIGTKEMIIEQIKTFKELGATDIMLNNHHNFHDFEAINSLVKYIIENNVL